jgi:catechol 2,3-dioxygenase-like lactoylglutathione lyase family enzyme
MLTTMIFAKDLERMTGFYRDGFDLAVDVAESTDGYTVLVGEGVRMSLHAIPEHIASTVTVSDPPALRTRCAFKLLFGVAHPPTTLALLERLGGQSFDTGDDDVWDVFDPEGNSLRIHPLP